MIPQQESDLGEGTEFSVHGPGHAEAGRRFHFMGVQMQNAKSFMAS
jgi:hypothetical protein